jgi:hypothetical protein
MHLHVDEINCPTAYNIGTAGDELNLFIGSLTGTETRVDATRVRVVKAKRNYYEATSNPTANDDANDGFNEGSWWLNTSTEDMWYCADPTAGSALWKRVIVSSSGVGNQQQILYVGLHGNDSAGGKSIDDAKLTIGAAITAAGTPANEAAAYTILVLDDGEYDEDLTHVSYVNIVAPSATLKGKQTLAANMSITARRLINDGDFRVIEMTAAGNSYVTAEHIASTSTTVEAIFINNSSSILHLASTRMEAAAYRLIEAQDGTIWLEVGSMNAATSIYTTGSAFVRGRINYITGTNGIVNGSGTGASVDLFVAVLSVSGTAYNITASNFLRMMASRISGTETIADGAYVTVTRAKRNNFTATTDPTVNDDANDGYTVGSVWINTSTDAIFVCMDATASSADWWPSNPGIVTAEPMGLEDSTDAYTTISWVDGTTTFSIAPAGSAFSVYVKGRKYTFTTAQTLVGDGTDFTIAEGLWYFYFNSSGVLTASQTVWDLSQHALVSLIYWDATNSKAIIFADERHGLVMDWTTHKYLHLTLGTRYQDGLGLSGTVGGTGNNDSDAQVNIANGTLWDEDLEIPIQDGTSGRFTQELSPIAYLPVFYLDGAGALWRADVATAFPLKQGTTYIQYNQFTGGAWTTTEAGQGNFVASWVMGSNDYDEPLFVILGQRVDNTLANARLNNNFESLSLSTLPLPEMKILYRLIFETRNGYTNTPSARTVDIQDLRNVSNAPSGTYVATSHNSTSGRDVYPTHPGESINYLDRQQVFYVGKHGSDGGVPYDGTDPEHAYLTIGAAITAAGTPANEAAAITIEVLDDATYTENVLLPSYVNLHAPLARIVGAVGVSEYSSARVRIVEPPTDTNGVGKFTGAGSGPGYIEVDTVNTIGTGIGVVLQEGELHVRVNRISSAGGGVSASAGTLYLDAGYVSAGGTALAGSGATVRAKTKHLNGVTAISATSGDIGITAEEVVGSTAAYNISSGAVLLLVVGDLSGTETAASGSDVNVSFAGGRDQTQVIYVGKSGNDSFDGLTPDKAKLTIANAITAAGTPASEAAAVRIDVLDSAEYDEDLTHVSYVNLCAPSATLKGTQTLAASMCIQARRFINDGANVIISKSTTGISIIKGELIWSNGAARMVSQSAGTLYIEVDRIEQTSDDCIYATNSGTIIRIQTDDIIVPATKYGIDVAGADVDGHIGAISGGIAIRVATGSAHLSVTEINSTTAYTVSAGATLRLLVAELSGTETAADTADVRVTKAKRNNYGATTDPTVNDDTNDGYDVGSMWLNTTRRVLWTCISAASGAAVWNIVSPTEIHLQFGGNTDPWFEAKSATYVIAGRMAFKGTNVLGTPTSAKFVASTDTGGGSVDCRIYDVTNAQVIAEYTGITSTTFAIYTDSTLTNLPTGEALFEVQIRDTAGQTAQITAASLHWAP